ncbi:MAG: type I glyceraldehyde-3-phosphate dehydrogenase [Parcubacteria group bacterium]|nr:type I glyceraldehyde-3-phosphate dehydrogenase [Parcubacteria group bacterium]
MSSRIAINGFGRIGRAFFKAAFARPELDIVAINDLSDPENLAYLLTYDTAYGRSRFDVRVENDMLIVSDGEIEKEITLLSERDPRVLPWADMDIDIVVECTGVFAGYEKSKPHLEAGAKRVVISAPVKDSPEEAGVSGATVIIGVNDEKLETAQISSNASCTTNATTPLIEILHEGLGIEKAALNTVHGYTSTQRTVDLPNPKDFRRGRAAAQNIIPTSTGAAIATSQVVPELSGLFDGMAIRVPVIVGSIADITFVASRETSVEEVNDMLRSAAEEERWLRTFSTVEEPVVSSDIIGCPYASLVDLSLTQVIGGTLVKVLAWYDNETGYANALTEHVIASAQYIG